MDQTFIESLIKISLSILVGGVIGAEREFQDKAAGLRTIILITLGSAIFTIFSLDMDPGFSKSRVAANIVTGIGFLGAGAIMRDNGRIAGLTTAATIWLSAALGMGIGVGEYYFVIASTIITLLVLLVFPRFEGYIDRMRVARSYRIIFNTGDFKKFSKIEKSFTDCDLRLTEHHQTKTDKTIVGRWRAIGSPKNQEKFVNLMLRDKDIKELDY